VTKKNDVDELVISGRSSSSDLVKLLQQRAPRTALTIAMAQAAKPVYQHTRSWINDKMSYTIAVHGDDTVYEAVHEWVVSLIPSQRQRSLVAVTTRRARDGKWGNEILLQYDGKQDSTVKLGSHFIRIAITEGRFETEGTEGGAYKPPELQLIARSIAGRDAIIEKLSELARSLDNQDRRPSVKMYGEWGWDTISEVPVRPLNSVILPTGQMDRIIGDMQRFLDAEAAYVHRGIPYHRGYLFTGPPRTGKTSVARALAGYFGMDLWYIPLGDVRKDGDLMKRVTQVPPRSVMLLEDLDIFHAAKSRDDAQDGHATLAGLLNATDGAGTPHGLITIMTSNEPDQLDSALIQPGRVDLVEHFGLCTMDQASDIIRHYYGDTSVPRMTGLVGVSPAEVMEACKRCDRWQDAVNSLLAGDNVTV
jgi:hypothetical protein